MNLRLLREFTMLVSAHSEAVIQATEPIAEAALWSFWDQARQHVIRWSTFLEKSAVEIGDLPGSVRKQTWLQAEPVLAEVFGLDMLTRVWATVLVSADTRRHISHAAPVARSAVLGQRHLRHLCLNLLVNGSSESEPLPASIDRFRRRIERWTDVLIGHLAARYGVTDFAFDRKRAVEFGRDQLDEASLEPNSPIWKLIHSGMQISFPDSASPRISNPQHLYVFAQSVIDGLPLHLCRPGRPFASFIVDSHQPTSVDARSTREELPTILPLAGARRSTSDGLSFAEIRRQHP